MRDIEWGGASVRREGGMWRALDERLSARAARAARAAGYMSARAAGRGYVGVLLTDAAAVRGLNVRFRGVDEETDVLSFPLRDEGREEGRSREYCDLGEAGYLGDVALAYEVCARDASRLGVSTSRHAARLTVHGVLHLLGWDHEGAREARAMAMREDCVMGVLGLGMRGLVGALHRGVSLGL